MKKSSKIGQAHKSYRSIDLVSMDQCIFAKTLAGLYSKPSILSGNAITSNFLPISLSRSTNSSIMGTSNRSIKGFPEVS